MKKYYSISTYILAFSSIILASTSSICDFLGYREDAIMYKGISSILFVSLAMISCKILKNMKKINTYS